MKKLLFVATCFVGLIGCVGCASMDRAAKSFNSELGGGLNRIIKVYTADGTQISTYEGNIDIEDTEYGNKVLFDLDGKRIVLYNATVIVEEK